MAAAASFDKVTEFCE